MAANPTVPQDLRDFCADAYPRIVGSMQLYTGDRALAEELAQETFVRVCRDWHRLEQSGNRLGWAQTVAFNLAKSRFRRRYAKRRADTKARNMATAAESNRNAMPDRADVIAVREAVLALDPKEREVIVMRYFSSLSVAETATALNLAEGTVKTRTRRGIESLRASGLALDPSEAVGSSPPPADLVARVTSNPNLDDEQSALRRCSDGTH